MTAQKTFLPKNIIQAHELFLRALHLDQQGKWEEARKMYFQSGKIFTALIKKFPDMLLFYLWSEEARLAINRTKQLTANQSPSNAKSSPTGSKDEQEQSELHQRILRTRLVPNPNFSRADIIGLDRVIEELNDVVFLPFHHPGL